MALTLMPACNFSLASFWFASASSKYVCKPTWQTFQRIEVGKHTAFKQNRLMWNQIKATEWPPSSHWLLLAVKLHLPQLRTQQNVWSAQALMVEKHLRANYKWILTCSCKNTQSCCRFATLFSSFVMRFLPDFDVHICQQSQDLPTIQLHHGPVILMWMILKNHQDLSPTLLHWWPKGDSWFLAMPHDWKAAATSPERLPTLKVGPCSTHLTCPWPRDFRWPGLIFNMILGIHTDLPRGIILSSSLVQTVSQNKCPNTSKYIDFKLFNHFNTL